MFQKSRLPMKTQAPFWGKALDPAAPRFVCAADIPDRRVNHVK